MENVVFLIYFFILGTIVGSFLNVVVERTKHKKSFLLNRSACPMCGHILNVWDLIPLFSYIFLNGKCRYCQKKISWQYFVMELVTGVIFGLIYLSVETIHELSLPDIHNILLLFFYLIIASFLIIIFVYDLKYYLILDKIVVPGMVVALIGNFLLGRNWLDLLLGAVIGSGIFLLQYTISRGKWVGGGDIRLGLFMGLILGWKLVLVALFISYLFGATIGVGLILLKRKKMQDTLPFATFLSVATLITMLCGSSILTWYINLF